MPDSPIGSIIAYAGGITREWEDQNGWLHCDGRLLDSTQPDNAALFKAIGFAWGGDGDSTCRICRDFFYAAWIQTVPNHREIAVCLFRPIKIAISGFRSVLGGMTEIRSVLLNVVRQQFRLANSK